MNTKIKDKDIYYELNTWYTLWEWFIKYIEYWLEMGLHYWVLRSKTTKKTSVILENRSS